MLKIENAEGTVLAFLNNLTEAKVHEVLNGEYTLSFVAIIDHLKTDFLYDEQNLINYNDDLFRVVTLEELHDEDDMLTVACECEHISYDLISNVMSDFNYTYKSALEVMTNCLLGTDFSLRSCNITLKTDIQYTEECNSKQICIAIANNWKGELKYYRHYIDLLQSRGANRGTGFIFGKNLKSVKRIINRTDKTTSYEVEVVEGSETEELGYYELGDTVRIIDQRLNVDYHCKIIEIEKDILTGINSNIVLGDAIKDMRSTFSSVKKDVEEVKATIQESAADWDKIKNVTDNNGNIILGKLNALTNIASKIINSTGTYYQEDGCSCWQNQPTFEASTFATKWSAQGLVFANAKKNNNTEWDWQTAIDANGVTATSVTASCLNAITANISSAIITDLVGKTITGVTIEGSTIYAGDRTNGTYMEMTKGGDIIGYAKGKQTIILRKASEGRIILGTDIENYSSPIISLQPIGSLYGTSVTNPAEGASVSGNGGEGLQLDGGGAYIVLYNGGVNIYTQNKNGTVYIEGSLDVTGSVRARGGIS